MRMGIKSYIRERVIGAVRYAIREELSANGYNLQTCNNGGDKTLEQMEEEIVQRLDKQIERWTWERYKRTNSLFEVLGYDLEHDLSNGIENMEKRIKIVNEKEIGTIKDTVDEKVKYWTAKRFDQTDKQIERWTWERYKRSEDKLLYIYKLQNQISELLFQEKKVLYQPGEKVRIVFLFQVASFFPSWESFYKACLEDDRIDAKFLFLDETVRERVQMKTAKDFLNTQEIEYIDFDDFDINTYKPHVIVVQTPYDAGHRIKAHWSSAWKAQGYRVVYIPYGIEISDTETSHGMHFEQHVIENAWRVYTFSDVMLKDYRKYCLNAGNVRVLGLPKFDSLYYKERFKLDEELVKQIAGRKVCLWKVHFPKIFTENGKDMFVTPDVYEYIKFAEYAAEHEEIFFIFMPHPRFQEPVKNQKLQQLAIELMNKLENVDNVYIDKKDDYRYSLVNADFIIIDRSAVMVEAAAIGVPILYMVNTEFYEPVTKAIEPLINSYEQGSTCADMISFTEACLRGEDRNKECRVHAFETCIPYFDGKAGERIKNDIYDSVTNEILSE